MKGRGKSELDAAIIIGYLASICSIASFVPQAWKVVRSGDTSALSARMYSLTVTGFALWTAFGLMRAEVPIILTNAICFCLSAFILFRILKGANHNGTGL
ncbi:SemiSWEET family sugar transporter [Pararhizobium arenae]|uniref:SemiSWEET family sugar transporter n=1 Tax=Pararhizobium arenae TaxID=1856850 RepID=UPI00094AC9DA|nr:SemiSWEET family transporter [Pararhizobium arenae]